MAATPTTKSQVQAYRFVLRRMEHALVRKDAVMLHDPMRTQVRATAVGLVLGIILLVGFALVSVFRPADNIDGAAIVIGKGSGAIFVQRDGVLHPVLNLASARLLTSSTDAPASVADNVIEGKPRGALLGIPGAPTELPGGRPAPVWTVCDSVDLDETLPARARADAASVETTVIAGALDAQATPLRPEQALYVRAPDLSTHVIYDARRAEVDPTDTAVVRALNLSGLEPRKVSSALLNAVPVAPPITAPAVPSAGAAPSYDLGGQPVGSVVSVRSGDDTRYYVLLLDGVQVLSPTVAQVVAAGRPIQPVEPAALTADIQDVSTADGLGVMTFPDTALEVLDPAEQPVGCLSWDDRAANGPDQDPTLSLVGGAALPLPEGAAEVELAQADAAGQLVDSFYLAPGQAAVVRGYSTGQPAGVGTRYLVSDVGVRYGIPADPDDAAQRLGVDGEAPRAPESILLLLPTGPELSAQAAMTAHDGAPGADRVAGAGS